MKVLTSELIGIPLDWVVAKCEGWTEYENDAIDGKVFRKSPKGFTVDWRIDDNSFSEDWSLAGPIIERELLSPSPRLDNSCALIEWECWNWKGDGSYLPGPTALIAAMRCYVASKLGNEVDIPDELLA